MVKRREDSIKEMNKRKSNEQLTRGGTGGQHKLGTVRRVRADDWRHGVMAKIYTALIQKGLKTIDDVPARIRAEVEALLAEQDHE